MKVSNFTKLLSVVLAMVITFTTLAVSVSAADGNSGKYVKDVFVAYGEERAKAEQWLRENGWEPICDLNDGKTSGAMTNAVAVLGIQRTNNPKEAITDMATMYMKGGYSFDDYENLVKQKKADIDEFINTFVPALNEYRDNYNGKGSEGGQKRAQMAHDILNKFFDGDPNGQYAVNDTGKPLGDLLLNQTKTEIGDEAYNALSAEQKLNTADLQQIILESSGPAVQIIEQTLALATDTADDTWLDRLDGLTGDDLAERIEEFAPEAKGQDLAPSVAMSLLAAHFEDYAEILADQWYSVREDILWYEEYCEANDLWQGNDEDGDAYIKRRNEYFAALFEEDRDRYLEEYNHFSRIDVYYTDLQETDYSGEWGDTLFDFFFPEDEDADYSRKSAFFAPLAAALSPGQRAALGSLSLSTLLRLGMDNEAIAEFDFPSLDSLFKDEDGKELKSISIYSGINRAIFRKGVALTSQTLMQKAMGKDPYDQIWDKGGIADIVTYTTFATGAVSLVVGFTMSSQVAAWTRMAADFTNAEKCYFAACENMEFVRGTTDSKEAFAAAQNLINRQFDRLQDSIRASNKLNSSAGARFASASRWLMGIGGALMVLAAVLKGVQLYQYYNRTFTAIPTMIVDEADIVSHITNKKGDKVEVLTFDQFVYYEAVKCNRQKIGIHTSAQNGVEDYAEWGCGDVADINADVGKQWLALYVNRSEKKGNPILADTLTLKTGKDSEKMPKGYTGCLHMFMEENPVKIDHEDYCYRSDNGGMYLYWKGDASAFTASTFGTSGVIALSAIGGLIVGILGATVMLLPKKKKKTVEVEA